MGKRRRSPLPLTSTLEVEVSIAELSPGGSGVAVSELDGERRAIFVDGVARGERVRVAVDTTQRPARGRVLELLQRSAARVDPPCAHHARCGACDWMHLAPAEQRDEHRRIVEQLLRTVPKHGQPTSHVAVKDLGYRTRARLHVQAREGRVLVGMFARRSHEPVSVDSCVILDPILDRARAELATWLDGAEGRGEALLSLGSLGRPGSPRLAVLDLRWSGELPAHVFGRLERAVGSTLGGARVFAGEVRIPAKIGDPTPYIVAADGDPLRLAPGGFSQATEAGNALLSRRVAEVARTLPEGPCVELHAGAGNHTVLLARDRSVIAVERDAEACEAARANLAARSLAARVVQSDAATFAIPRGTKLVVLDPPREGAREVAEALAKGVSRWRRPAIVYVSCDAPTLARDLELLATGGYVVRSVETFEMFPHTSHVETLVVATSERLP